MGLLQAEAERAFSLAFLPSPRRSLALGRAPPRRADDARSAFPTQRNADLLARRHQVSQHFPSRRLDKGARRHSDAQGRAAQVERRARLGRVAGVHGSFPLTEYVRELTLLQEAGGVAAALGGQLGTSLR